MSFVDIPPGRPVTDFARAVHNHANQANYQNAQLSTGPRSEAGKTRVRWNALRHALSGRTCMLPGDDLELYQKLGAYLTRRWKPETEQEYRLVAQLHDTQWRLDRIPALEMDLESDGLLELYDVFEHEQDEQFRQSRARVAAAKANARQLDQIRRHEGRLNRMVQRIEDELRFLAEERREQQAARRDEERLRRAIAAMQAAKKSAREASSPEVSPETDPVGFELSDTPASPPEAVNAPAQEGGK